MGRLGLSRFRVRGRYAGAVGQRRSRRGPIDNGKPVARRGRKATGLTQVAGLPNWRWTVKVRISPRARQIALGALNLGAVLAVLVGAAASIHI
jgi:hypothetical protein